MRMVRNSGKCAGTRTHRQRGAAVVEFALVFVSMMAIVFAIFDFSMPLFLRAMFISACREGVRLGVTHTTTFNGASYSSQTLAIKACVRYYTLGLLPADTSTTSPITVTYYQLQTSSGTTSYQAVTGTNANAGGNIIQVAISNYSWGVIAPLLRSGNSRTIPIYAVAADRLESIAVGSSLPTP